MSPQADNNFAMNKYKYVRNSISEHMIFISSLKGNTAGAFFMLPYDKLTTSTDCALVRSGGASVTDVLFISRTTIIKI
jgi:hypothetical protein